MPTWSCKQFRGCSQPRQVSLEASVGKMPRPHRARARQTLVRFWSEGQPPLWERERMWAPNHTSPLINHHLVSA